MPPTPLEPHRVDIAYIRKAVALANQGAQSKHGGPFGAVIVRNQEIIAKGYNQVISTHDPTAHAEVVAIREAAKLLGNFHLTGCVLYTTCEPCPMCLGAIYWARIDRVVYALTRADAAAMGFSDEDIYDELSKPLNERRIEMTQVGRQTALHLIEFWRKSVDKQLY